MPAQVIRRLTADELERQRFCSIGEAAIYLGRSYQHVHALVKQQRIESVYDNGRRMVVVKSLKAYGDGLTIDPPEAS